MLLIIGTVLNGGGAHDESMTISINNPIHNPSSLYLIVMNIMGPIIINMDHYDKYW